MSDAISISNELTLRAQSSGAPLGKIDQYELLQELGGGGFGCVFLAKDTVAGINVAVKGLPPEVKHNKEELENIRANFALVSRLHHPHIAAALVLHPAKEVSYANRCAMEKLRVFERDTMLVMEYAPGVPLSQWRKQFPEEKVPFEKALDITRQVAAALDYAHGEKVIHRDVKPSNVMIETKPDGSVVARVLDFGLAAEIRSSMGHVSREVREKSGTRPYMAPEQWLGQPQREQTDQYSLAVMFYELLRGKVPFASVFETGDVMVMKLTVTQQPFRPNHRLPRPAKRALRKALAKKPEQRYGTCAEFVEALEKPVPVRWWIWVAGLAALVALNNIPFPPVPTPRPEPKPPVVEQEPEPIPEVPAIEPVKTNTPPVEVRYKISYGLSDGVNGQGNPAEYKSGDLPIQLAAPRRAGYKFIGWEPAGRIEAGTTGDLRFVAKWEKVAPPKPKPVPVPPKPKPVPAPPKPLAPLPPRPIAVTDFVRLKTSGLVSGFCTNVTLFGTSSTKMIWCAGGTCGDGKPITGFWLGKFEVSQALWSAVMREAPSHFPAKNPETVPVESVSRDDCLQFIDKLNELSGVKGFRLPREREWEYACRAGTRTAFFWGDGELSDRMCVEGRSDRPMSSGRYAANNWGFCDMHGNVAEWCDDRFGGSGDDAEDAYVLRGGDWRSSAGDATSSSRKKFLTYNGTAVCGLRLCFSVPEAVAPTKKVQDSRASAPVVSASVASIPSARPANLKPGESKRITLPGSGVTLELLWCPPGAFLMGSPVTEDDRILGAEDQHSVVLAKGFWISKYEVTKLMWQEVMKDDSIGMWDKEQEPKSGVSWNDCMSFIARLNGRLQGQGISVRLPTEAEWEYACRAGTTNVFSFGNALNGDQACCNGEEPYGSAGSGKAWRGPAAVGNFPKFANRWGLNDMHGNLSEWCADWYGPYSAENQTDPTGPASGRERVVRGGSWKSAARQCRSAFRTHADPGVRNDTIGFRLCVSGLEGAEPVAKHIPVRTVRPEELKAGTCNRIEIALDLDPEFRWCPPGSFLMGSPASEDELHRAGEDRHEVVFAKGFWMAKFEVTKQVWQSIMDDGSVGLLGGAQEPKSEVSWHDCMDFIGRLNRRLKGVRVRLPTEAEWEYACRAGTTTAFSFGNVLNGDQACCNGNEPYGTLDRGETWKNGPAKAGNYSKFANKWGLNDMHGNLFEWCADWYASYAPARQVDPAGPATGEAKVVRGGCWRYAARLCRSAFRTRYDPETRNDMIGFRLCCDQLERKDR